MNIIRKTKSICPHCFKFLDALVVEKEGKVFLSKTCSKDGKFEILLSKTPALYRELDKFYFSVMDKEKMTCNYEIWLTSKCNLDCPICALKENTTATEIVEPSCAEIGEFARKDRHHFYSLASVEPTCRGDICKIIQTLKKCHKVVTLNTNGLKLTDILYATDLKLSGLDRVDLQFDGFNREVYKILRGKDLLDMKLKVLENLKSLDIRTTLNATVARNINENEIVDLIAFGLKNDFISGVTFLTIFYDGGARDWSLENYIMPDELIDIIEKKTNRKISKKNVLLFQKLHLAIKSFLGQRCCLYNQIFLLVRYKNSYEPIDMFLNLAKGELWLDRYQKAGKKNKVFPMIYLTIAIIAMLANQRSLFIIKEIILSGLSYFIKTSRYLKSRSFFALSFTTGCDPYKVDYNIVRNCQNEIIAVNKQSKKLGNLGREGPICLNSARNTITTGEAICSN